MNTFTDGQSFLRYVIGITAVVLLGSLPVSSALAAGFWPLGEEVPVHTLKEEYVPFKGKADISNRPKLFIEQGDAFLGTGKLDKGFEVPGLGAVWQPRLWSYFINRTALQTFDNHAANTERETEIANRMDLYFNLQLTGTEKILLGLRPFDNNRSDRFTRYTFEGASEDSTNELNTDVETLFFEGDLGSLVPNLDPAGTTPGDVPVDVEKLR